MRMMTNESGFTLIDVIASLILAGIMAAAAGMALVTASKAYLLSKDNAQMAQKAQFAMARLSRELTELTDVTSASATAILYERPGGQFGIASVDRAIKVREGSVLPDSTTGHVLIDNVDSFSLSYFKKDQPWQTGTDDIQLLSAIQIDLVLAHTDTSIGSVRFSTTVHPRNNMNYGGAPSNTEPPTTSSYGCFISTASSRPDQAGGFFTGQCRNRILFSSLIVLLAVFGLRRAVHHSRKEIQHGVIALDSQGGSVLIGLLAAIVLLSALGAALLSLTSTAVFTLAGAHSARKAFFLAESGYRYAASQYLNAEDGSVQEGVMESLHDQTFTLAGNDGQFRLEVYPYWYKTTQNPIHGTEKDELETKVVGGFPPGMSPDRGYLRIGTQIHHYKRAAVHGSHITFERNTGNWPSISVGTDVFPVCQSTAQTVTKGGTLDFKNNSGGWAFPAQNGQIEVNGRMYRYKKRDLVRNRFTGITNPTDPHMPDLTLTDNTNIILPKFVDLHSTGTIGRGAMAASREITFSSSLSSASTGSAGTYYDTFEQKDNWSPTAFGSHDIASVEGNNALEAARTKRLRTSGERERASLTALNWGQDFANLEASWRANGYFLSYDTQIKVKAAPRAFYMAGVTLRMDLTASKMLGVSFLQGDNSATDRIPNSLVPMDNTPLIVLWQIPDSGIKDLRWLAYRELTAPDHGMPMSFFSDDMESGPGVWNASTYQYNQWGQVTNRSHSGSTSWNESPGGNYHPRERSALISTGMDLSKASSATLVFWHTHYFANDNRDLGRVYISTNGGTWNRLQTYSRNQTTWKEERIDISSYIPSNDVKIGFQFTSDRDRRVGEGWYIDDVSILGSHPEWDTIMVRIEEHIAEADPFAGQRVNDMKVYIGSTAGLDAAGADGSPLDAKRHGNPRWSNPPGSGEIYWPPRTSASWAPENDHFTLIQDWFIHTAEPSIALTGTMDEPNAILRMNSFTTPQSGTFSQEEIGLHTFGRTRESGAPVYFDDFAIRLPGGPGSSEFLPPIQQ